MRIKNPIIAFFAALVFPLSAFALSAPTVENAPDRIDTDFYTLEIHVPIGSKVSVIGGPSNLAPMTDGAGSDELDGVINFLVGLAQEQVNVFSISAERNGEFSDSITVSIHETSVIEEGGEGEGEEGGEEEEGELPRDQTPPPAPVIDPIEGPVKDYEYEITGSSEALANIYVEKTDGVRVGSTQANSNGFFHVTVDLEAGKTNRFNVYAEDAAYNIGPGTQAVIQALVPDVSKEAVDYGITAPKFIDIQDHWAAEFIMTIYEMGIVSGKSETRFDPNAYITRAELTKIAVNAFNVSPVESITSFFSDVSESAWYFQYIAAAKNAKIVDGYSDNTFRPNDFINRAAALKILLEASGLELGNWSANFSDVPGDAWFAPYVAYAKTNGIVGGYEDGTFGPGNFITRAEVSKIVTKILALME